MVLQKKLDYGSNGYHVPDMPHVPKSARRKRSVRKKVEGNPMCAFDLLATVAGNLLEGENSAFTVDIVGSSSSSTIKEIIKIEQEDFKKKAKAEALDQHSSNESIPDSGVVFGKQICNPLKEHKLVLEATITGSSSGSTKSREAQHHVIKVENDKDGIEFGITTRTDKQHTLNNTPSSEKLHLVKGEGTKRPLQNKHKNISNVFVENAPGTNNPEDPMDLDVKPPLLSSGSIAEVQFCTSSRHSSSFSKDEDAMELIVDKDDDENSSGCTHSSILSSKARRPQRIGDRRIRKLLASKYWKIPSTTSQNLGFSSHDVDSKSALHNKRLCYTRQRTQRSCFKRRKLVERYSLSTPFDDLSSLYKMGDLKYEGANDASSSLGKKSSHSSSDYHVKLGIKSFNVPELLIDIPETATVGSLKQTVMEAVTAILEGGLRIGVLFQGKKVRDENKTLCQAGISHGDQLDSLDFVLEPHSVKYPPLSCNEDANFIGIADVAEPLASLPPIAHVAVGQGDVVSAPEHVLTPCHDSDPDSVHLPTDSLLLDEKESNLRALVVVPPVNIGALTVVPQQKSRHTEAVQRRIRRPFTVAEVEALVQAVEKLGTGRWRDVKLRAFDNAKHRTYVDLKDKWKTLVHTAKISPQQRRGEPVPQELLERVLIAHAHWSHQPARLQLKPPPHAEPLSFLN